MTSRDPLSRPWLPAALAFALLVTLSACGNNPEPADTAADSSAASDTGAGGADAVATDGLASGDAPQQDAAQQDAAGGPDAGPGDAGNSDGANTDANTDANADGAGGPGPKSTPWGGVTGACGAVTAELKQSGPSFLTTTLTFSAAAKFDPKPLATGPKKRYEGDNAGGSSICSEVMSMQLLHECEGAVLYKTENEVQYTSDQGAITDYITTIAGEKVGVSVTRAYKGPVIDTYSAADAKNLLEKKLAGINASTAKISAGDKWVKQVLHVWTLRPDWVPTLKGAWQGLSPTLRADTVVLVSVEVPPKGTQGWIVPDDCGL